jgi:opacity protein-like surface antigen
VKKKIAIVVGTLAVLAVIAAAAYAAYDIAGLSGAEGFTSGTAADLVPDPQAEDLSGILPGQTRTVDVLITNNNNVPAKVTGLSLAFNDGGACAFTVANNSSYPYNIGASASVWDSVNVTMGDAAPGCENNSGLTVTATATGTLP